MFLLEGLCKLPTTLIYCSNQVIYYVLEYRERRDLKTIRGLKSVMVKVFLY